MIIFLNDEILADMDRSSDTNSIRYPKEVDIKLEKLTKGFKRSKKELFCQMVEYFYRSKKDPSDPGDEILKKELSSGINRILSFVRQQEKDFLLPLLTDTGIVKAALSEQKKLQQAMGNHLLADTVKTELLIVENKRLVEGIKFLVSNYTEKEVLKSEFLKLLEYYISQREEMGWTTSSIKKEELISHIKTSIKNL